MLIPLAALLACQKESVTEFPDGLVRTHFSLIMNERKWSGLSADDRRAIERVSGEAAASRAGKGFDELERNAVKALEGGGVRISMASPAFAAEVRNRLTFIEEGWLAAAKARGVDGAAALAFYRKTAADIAAGQR